MAGSVVALGGEVDVPIRVIDTQLHGVHLRVVEPGHDVEAAQAGPQVPGAGALDRGQRVGAAHVGEEGGPLVRRAASWTRVNSPRGMRDIRSIE